MPKLSAPHYGFDAPGVIGTFAGGGLASLVMAGLAHRFVTLPWASGGLVAVLSLAGTVMLFLCSVMLGYAWWGKFRQRDYMMTLIAWRGNETVLDVGTGRGLLLIGAAKQLTTGTAIGIDVWSGKDLTGNNAEAARRNAAIEGVASRVEVRDGDARKLVFVDQSIDVVLSLYCLHNIEDTAEQEQACREIARVLKPGGKALIADYVPTHGYAKALAGAGLTVLESRSGFARVLAPMWMVQAIKPN